MIMGAREAVDEEEKHETGNIPGDVVGAKHLPWLQAIALGAENGDR